MGNLTAAPAQASVLVDDSQPSSCYFIQDDALQDTCNAFKLIEVQDEATGSTSLSIEFLFNGLRVQYLINADERIEAKEIDGRVLLFYPVITQSLELQGSEPEVSQPDGTCWLTPDYNEVNCQLFPDLFFAYTGTRVPSQQNSEVPTDIDSGPQSSTSNQINQ